jgi:DNA-binding response OmpR family regulator
MHPKFLLIEDDTDLSHDLKKQLIFEGFEVETAYDGLLGERLIRRNHFDCILLDVNIPGKNGYELVQSIRKQEKHIPVILLTAFGEIDDKLQGFACGADDYVTKPFYFKELLARIKVCLKRTPNYTGAEQVITIENLTIDKSSKQVRRDDLLIKLTAREFALLLLLAEAKGHPVSKQKLIQTVWGAAFEVNTNTIEVFINLLRNKIDKNFEPKLIKTRVGFGYYLGKEEP